MRADVDPVADDTPDPPGPPMKLVKWAQLPPSLDFTRHTSHSCHQLTSAGVSIFDPLIARAAKN